MGFCDTPQKSLFGGNSQRYYAARLRANIMIFVVNIGKSRFGTFLHAFSKKVVPLPCHLHGSKIVQMESPEHPEDTDAYHLQIRPAQAPGGKEVNLFVSDARRLPIQKKAPALKINTRDMHIP